MPIWTLTLPDVATDDTGCTVTQFGVKIARRNAKLAATSHPKPIRKSIIDLSLCKKNNLFPFSLT